MLYADESVLLAQDMKTPRELLAEALEEKRIRQVDLGRMLGYKNPYHTVHAWIAGTRKFGRRQQERVADKLGYSKNHFQEPDLTARLAAHIHRTFEEFLKSDIGKNTDEETRRTLRGIPFTPRRPPNVALYQAIALAMGGRYTADQLEQLEQDLRLNEELDRRNEKPPPEDQPPLKKPSPRGERRTKPVRQK